MDAEPQIYRAILHPRSCGLQTYTDEQLWGMALVLDGTGVFQGPGTSPAFVLAVRVVAEGVEALIRVWREGDRAINKETGSEGAVLLDNAGNLYVNFIEGHRYMGSGNAPKEWASVLHNAPALWAAAPTRGRF